MLQLNIILFLRNTLYRIIYTMSEEIPFSKRYIYNIDQELLKSLETLYFDSLSFEPKSCEEFINRRKDELNDIEDGNGNPNDIIQPLIVQPKPRNLENINNTLSKLKISKSGETNSTEFSNENSALQETQSQSEAESENSGSESSSEEEREPELATIEEQVDDKYESTISFMSTKSPLVLFKSNLLQPGQCFGVYKTSIDAIDSPNFDPLKILNHLTFVPERNPIPKDPIAAGISAIFMISSGHFAGAIISHLPHSTKGNKGSADQLQLQSVRLLAHKTFHRYTTRRKQGGSQSAMDDSKGKANSAGSTLRRYNEQALGKDIEELMDEWKPLIDQCISVFIRGSGKGGKNARGTGLIVRDPKDPKAIIKTGDPRVKMIPFGTKRPTVMELKKAWCELTYLKITSMPEVERSAIERRKRNDEMLNKSKESNKVEDKEFEELVKLSNDAISILKKSKAPALIVFMKKNSMKFNVNSLLEPQEHYRLTPTLLHYASRKGLSFMVQTLIVQLKADPSIQNSIGRTPFDIALDKETRYAFKLSRKLLGEECGIEWEATNIGEPMTREQIEVEMELKRREEIERISQEKREIKHQHETIVDEFKSKEMSKPVKTAIIGGPGIHKVTEEQKLSGLSEMQKMKLLREQRFRAIEARLKKQKEEHSK